MDIGPRKTTETQDVRGNSGQGKVSDLVVKSLSALSRVV
jgi:hypothetical protein